MKKPIITTIIVIISSFSLLFLVKGILWYKVVSAEQKILNIQNQKIDDTINSHRLSIDSSGSTTDPFGDDEVIQILFIGPDKRIGQIEGHCDAIQLITIDKKVGFINITAVPRGTYSPLPPGKGVTSSDYYISNACGLGGLEYGIKEIEKILGVKADYLVVINFSETLGILRNLHLPTTETLQWLRNRHGYAIGEPQRAHNHSTFIKQIMIQFVSTEKSKLDQVFQYIMYKLITTDLSFAQVQNILEAVSVMDIANHPEKIQLSMRPFYPVQDVIYDPNQLNENLNQTLGPIKHLLNKDDYSGVTEETVQLKLLDTIEKNINNPEFVSWAFENNLWLQIETDDQRLATQYNLLVSYLPSLADKQKRESLITDYLLEMENHGQVFWQTKAKDLLTKEINLQI